MFFNKCSLYCVTDLVLLILFLCFQPLLSNSKLTFIQIWAETLSFSCHIWHLSFSESHILNNFALHRIKANFWFITIYFKLFSNILLVVVFSLKLCVKISTTYLRIIWSCSTREFQIENRCVVLTPSTFLLGNRRVRSSFKGPNPTQLNPTQPNPSQAKPSQAKPSQANPTQLNSSQLNPAQPNQNVSFTNNTNRFLVSNSMVHIAHTILLGAFKMFKQYVFCQSHQPLPRFKLIHCTLNSTL